MLNATVKKPDIISRFFGWIFIGLIRIYQYTLSPLFSGSCRFTPSCSAYGVEAIRKFGAFKGGWLAMKRLGKCHPWGGHGHDPVP